ncbi:DNA integrity scanning protein DisA [compost metagenome]
MGLKRSSDEELLDVVHISRLLGYPASAASSEELISPRGYRVLNKIPRLPNVIIHNLVERFEHLPGVMIASIEELDEVDGIGEVRARTIKDGLKRLQEQVFIDRQI